MPSDLVMKTMNTMHRTILKISGGRIGWKAGNMPALELTTTGRKSGQPRTSMLTSPWQDGDKLAIVASAGGNDTHPAWFLNLRDNPDVEVRTEQGTRKMTARITAGDERATLWKQITSKHDNYAGYQTKTDREIPVVVLEPVE
jgi:deazaflavin-dependent oxidoreductase (nitroreductase family)